VIWQYYNTAIYYHSHIVLADLNNDGIEEIVIACDMALAGILGRTIALHANNGSVYWNVQVPSDYRHLIIADIDGTGYPYVYVVSHVQHGYISKLRGTDGAILARTRTYYPCHGGLSLADMDNDGDFELILADYNDEPGKGIHCYDAETLKLQWYNNRIRADPQIGTLADVNKDGILDVITTQYSSGPVQVINGATGVAMSGYDGLTSPNHSPNSIYDIDCDGNLEILVCSNSPVKVFDLFTKTLDTTLPYSSPEPPLMADVIGDSKLEILLTSWGWNQGIIIYNSTYTQVGQIKRGSSRWTLVQDIDNDGQNELIFQDSSNLIAYETSAYAPIPRVRTNMLGYSEKVTGAGVYTPPPGAPQPILKEESPKNGSLDVPVNPTLSVHAVEYRIHELFNYHIVDYKYDKMDITISTNASGTWQNLTSYTNIGNGIYTFTTTNMNQPDTTYYWRVTAKDINPAAGGITTTKIYHFRTKSAPKMQSVSISNSTLYQGQEVNITATITEDVHVDEVKLRLDYPDGSHVNKTLYDYQWTPLTYDDFESGWGNYTPGGTDCSLWQEQQIVNNEYVYTYPLVHHGIWAANIQANSGIASSFNLTTPIDIATPGYNAIKIDFWMNAYGMGGGYKYYLEYFDGTQWRTRKTYEVNSGSFAPSVYTDTYFKFTNRIFFHDTVWINKSSYNFPTNTNIRFRCGSGGTSNDVFIDQIYINATHLEPTTYSSTESFSLTGQYHYSIWCKDINGNTNSSSVYIFYVGNAPPSISNEIPMNNAENIALNPMLQADISDVAGDSVNWKIRTNASGTWVDVTSGTLSTGNGTISGISTSMHSYETVYYWSVNVSDLVGWTNETYQFTTISDRPIISNELPADGTTNVEINPTLQASITDFQGDEVNWSIMTNATGTWTEIASGTLSTGSGTISGIPTGIDEYETIYYWSVHATDSIHWTNETYSFTTESLFNILWTAYNDLAGSDSPSPATNYHSGNSGYLKNYDTGATLGVSVSITGGTNNGDGAGVLPVGTDAYNIFYGKINPTNVIYYTNPHVITFTGLNPSKQYRFVHWTDRARSDYTTRYTTVIISDVTSFATNSSTGVTISTTTVTDDSATYWGGYNSVNGYVAGFTYINPGADGDMTITVTSTNNAHYSSAFMLQEITTGPLPTQYTLTTNVVGSGSITKNPNQVTYNVGTIVTLTANAGYGWTFDSWSGDLSGSTNPTTITMNGNKAITATFTLSPSPSQGILEDFEDGFTIGQTVGAHADWYDGGSGPVVTSGSGVAGSIGLAASGTIFTWEAQPFNWSDPDVLGVNFRMDFESSSSGTFDDDRIGWATSITSTGSDIQFGVQLDDSDGGIVTFWRDRNEVRYQVPITTYSGIIASTFYRLRANITKLNLTTVKIDVSLTRLDSSGNEVEVIASGSLANTSSLGSNAPATRYFTATSMWPTFKTYSTAPGDADNAYYELIQIQTWLRIYNPYEDVNFATVNHFKGNFHTHTTFSDGSSTPDAVIYHYHNYGDYDILALTDHSQNTWPWSTWIAEDPAVASSTSEYYPDLGMLAIRGNEASNSDNVGVYLTDYSGGDYAAAFEYMLNNNGLGIFMHPGRYSETVSWYNNYFDTYDNILLGVEAYNQGDRYPSDRIKWDSINKERDPANLIWGYSNDDMHSLSANAFRNYQHFLMKALNESEFRTAMINGAFYFSYEPDGTNQADPNYGHAKAPKLTNVTISGSVIQIAGTNYTTIQWYNETTQVVGTGTSIDVSILSNTNFVRAVLINGSRMTYSQPFGFEVTTTPPGPTIEWTAYNDLAGDASPEPATNYHSLMSGALKNYATGETVSPSVSITGGTNNGNAPASFHVGTDAYEIFNGKINPVSALTYVGGTDHVLTFTGLDSSKTYRFVHWADRNSSGYTDRVSTVIISDVTSFTTNSSTGVTISTTSMPDDSATYCSGYNINGYVAGFTNINPGSDGDMIITVTSTNNYHYSNAFMLQQLGAGAVNTPPVVGDIPDQTIAEGATFATILLDGYVTDAEDPDTSIIWTFSGDNDLTVVISDRVATITAPTDWTGSETITFTATDTGALFDSDDATFTVSGPSAGWTAYNDFSGLNAANVGQIQTGSNGNMINYATGETLTVTLAAAGGGGSGGNSEGTLVAGTDAYKLFYGITDPYLNIWWYGTPDHTMTFTGLDPSKLYRFVHYADRGGDNTRYSNVIISDVDSFQVNSSSAVTIRTTTITNDTATYCGGYNLVGYVAGFTNITPGSDGDFTITVGSDDGHEYTTAIMLQELPSGTPPTQEGVLEDFEDGFAIGQTVGAHADWYDGGSGPVVTSGSGVAGSVGLAPASAIFTWTAHPFNWNDADFIGFNVQMDFESSGSGTFDDDRIGWTINSASTSSDYQFGVQLDDANGGIVTYWRHGTTRINIPIATYTGITANTYYRLRADITKLTATSARIDVSLVQLDSSGNPTGTPFTGSIADTSTMGTNTPNDAYFTATTMWPTFKNYNAPLIGDADNAYYELITSSGPTNTPPVVSDIPDQTITVGDTFTTITLDNYVSDVEDPDTSISWTPSGYTDLIVTIANRIAIITAPADWTGTETVTFTATDTGALFDSDDATFTVNAAPTVGWTAYNDLVGTSTPEFVTEYDYSITNGILKDFTTGSDLPVTITCDYDLWDMFTTNGGNFNAGTDAYLAFNDIVDVTGTFELELTSYQSHITFNNLNPNKQYTITLTANRNEPSYLNQRYAKVTIEGAETYTQASSTGVVINSDASVSFSVGYNTVNGYVARWTEVTSGSDGSFTITNEWDNSQGSGSYNTKGYAMSAFRLEETTPASINFTIIALPDTQNYASGYPTIFTNQTQWIVDHKDALNIVYVTNEGDITNGGSDLEFQRADAAYDLLENPITTQLPYGIPYTIIQGNHDHATNLFNTYFNYTRFEGRTYYGGHYPATKNDNNYANFSAGGMDFIAIGLDYAPDPNELVWAENLLIKYPTRRAIVISHDIMNYATGDWTTNGLAIYNALKDNPNLFLILCGHNHYEARRTDTYNGNTIYSLLADYQDLPDGGNGWLRIMEFCPATNEIKVKTYSPYLNQYQIDDDSQFTLSYDMTPTEDQPPVVTLNSPVNDSLLTSSSVTFDSTSTDDNNLENITLYLGSADQGTSGSIDVRVSTGTDDAEEYITDGYTYYTSTDLELGYDDAHSPYSAQIVGTRFNNIQIPQGATITNAYVEFECDVGTWTGDVPLQITGEDIDNAPTFTATTYSISARTDTTATVPWTITAQWTVDSKYPSSDIISVIQEIINRPGWSSGNSMVIMFTASGTNRREMEAYEGGEAATAAPRLVVEYIAGGGPLLWHANETKTISGTTNTITFTKTLPDGDYRWNVLVYDNAGNSAFASSDYFFIVNTTVPPVYYTLYTNSVGSGTVTPASGNSYAAGTVVDVEATADSGWQFDSWSGDLSGSDNPTTITMDSDKTITATFVAQAPSTGWIVYNDLVYDPTKYHAATNPNGQLVHYKANNITTYGIGTNYNGPTSGLLYDFATNTSTDVTVTITQNTGVTSVVWQPDISSSWTGGYDPAVGTDARNTFGGIADMTGVVYYGGTGWWVDLTFTGLDPSKEYTFATSAARCGSSTYANRITIYTLSGADTYTQASTSGVTVNAPNQVQFCTGRNYDEGYVARWTGITAVDGSFTVRAQATASVNNAYSFDVFMLQEISSGPTNNPPIVSDIPDQTINEGETFATINLDDYVTDVEDPDTSISWAYLGNTDLTVSITDRAATITIPNVDWNGAETITFTATDTGALFDSDDAIFIVNAAPTGILENFNTFTPGSIIGSYPGWYGSGTPVVTSGIGVSGSIGLAPGQQIFTWTAHPFDWNAADFLGVNFQMDFQTDGSGHFDDDRVGYMITDANYDSTNYLGVQLDPGGTGYNIETYWKNTGGGDARVSLVSLPTLNLNGWYRLRLDITKLTATSFSLTTTLTELDSSGNPVQVVASSSIADTTTLGTDAPNSKYFTGPIWPAYKNYNVISGAADNAYYELITSGGNTPPIVIDIPDQTIAEGSSFTTINLNDYVSDVETLDADIIWSYSGQTALTVSIVDQVATIGIPSVDWNGAETITFTATDAGSLFDSDAATFTVTGVNDPPVVSGIPDQTITAGSTFTTINLDDYVTDVDNTDAQMTWTYTGNSQLAVSIVARVATITYTGGWTGAETITFTATDPGALFDTDDATFTVNVAPVGVLEDFNAFTPGATIGTYPGWYDGGAGPVVTSGNGVAGTIGLAAAANIFTWTAHPFNWNAVDFHGFNVQMDIKSSSNGKFDDDRIGWAISTTSVDSTNQFGVQLDDVNGGLVTFWRASDDTTRVYVVIAPYSGIIANTYYRLRADITKLTATSAKIDVSLVKLDSSGNPTGTPFTGTILDTSTMGANAPHSKYFTATTIWPTFKTYSSAEPGPADNVYYEIITSAGNTPPVVTDIPDQTITGGSTFSTITLDDYVSDVDDPDASISWTSTGNTNLIVTITNRVATITYPNGWTGSETITFTATDSGALFDSDEATFTVNAPSAGWTAYNDVAGSSIPPTYPNVTNYHTAQGGTLTNYLTGSTLGVTVAVSGGSDTGDSTSTLTPGTDAYKIFYGKINPDYIMWYGGGNHYFTFTGLDPSKTYRFVHWADRGAIAHNNTRYSTITISDVTSFITNSSTGVTISTSVMIDDSGTYCTGYNSLRGYVAGFTDIDPGSDGDMTITVTSTDSHQYSSAFMLQELPT
jgi:hypothetical protein